MIPNSYPEPQFKTIDYTFDAKTNSFKPQIKTHKMPRWRKPPIPKGGNGVGAGAGAGATIAVGIGGFLAGAAIGTEIYKDAEVPNSWTVKVIDAFQGHERPWDDALTGQSQGGKSIQEPEYPFLGGQGQGKGYTVYYSRVLREKIGNAIFERVTDALWGNFNGKLSLSGKITKYKSDGSYDGEEYRLYYNGSTTQYTGNGCGSFFYIESFSIRVVRQDGTTIQNDINTYGNPNPTRAGILTDATTSTNTNAKPDYSGGVIRVGGVPQTNNNPNNTAPSSSNTSGGNTNTSGAGKPSGNTNPSGSGNPSGNPSGSPKPSPKPISEPTGKPTSNNAPTNAPKPSPNPQELPSPNQGRTPYTFYPGEGTGEEGEGESTSNQPFPYLPDFFPPIIPNPNTNNTPAQTPNSQNPTETNPNNQTTNTTGQPQTTGGQCCTPPGLPEIGENIKDIKENQISPELLAQSIDLSLLTTINNKLGDALPGGLSGFLTKAWRSTRLQKVMDVLGLALQLHNAAMLSRNLGESIDTLIGNTLSLIGIEDEEGNPIDFSAIIGDTITNTIKGIIGESTYNGVSTQWKKLSAIYTAVVNIYELSTSIMAGIAEGLQTSAQYTGKIGNALKKSGVILENSYEWMDENVRIKTGKLAAIDKVIDGLQSAEEVTENLTEVTETIQETSETVNEIKGEVENIRTQAQTNVDTKTTEENTAKTNSQGANINITDLNKP